jgi:hypothetical protein
MDFFVDSSDPVSSSFQASTIPRIRKQDENIETTEVEKIMRPNTCSTAGRGIPQNDIYMNLEKT